MATLKPGVFIYKAPHLGTDTAAEIKKIVVDEYIVPLLEKYPRMQKLSIVVTYVK